MKKGVFSGRAFQRPKIVVAYPWNRSRKVIQNGENSVKVKKVCLDYLPFGVKMLKKSIRREIRVPEFGQK